MPRVFSDVAVYEWEAWDDFLITKMLPGATRIPSTPVDSPRRILSLLPPGCRYFVFHINCTFSERFVRDRDELLAELERRGIRVLNGCIIEISKAWLQWTCKDLGLPSTAATRDGPADELIIVKTSRNSGGASERRLRDSERRELGIDPQSELVTSLTARFKEYPVLQRRDIPSSWWRDQQLFMERFIRNSRDRIYRAWFLLDRITVATATCRGNTKKFARTLDREFDISSSATAASIRASAACRRLSPERLDPSAGAQEGFAAAQASPPRLRFSPTCLSRVSARLPGRRLTPDVLQWKSLILFGI